MTRSSVSAYEKAIKDGLVERGDTAALQLQRLPFGVAQLDEAIGGGLPVAGITLIAGLESTGKTMLCQYATRSQQQREQRTGVLYFDMERSYERTWWERSGVDVSRLHVARPNTGEELIDIVGAAMDEDPDLGLIILDSIAATPPEAIVEAAGSQATMAQLARLMSKFYAKVIPKQRAGITLIMTNQLRHAFNGPGYDYPGGMAQRYYAHLILHTRRVEWITEDAKRVGYRMEIETRKNKTAPPQRKVELPFRFDSQIDQDSAIAEQAIEAGLIEKRAPYYKLADEDGELHNLLGMKNLRDFLQAHPAVVARLQAQMNGAS